MRAFGGDQNFVSQTSSPSSRRPRPVRPAASSRATPRCASWSPAGCRSTGSCSATSSPSTTSTAPTAGSTRCARRARLVSSIRDRSKVDAFAREIAGMVGVDVEEARAEVRRAASRPARAATTARERAGAGSRRRRGPRAAAARPARPAVRARARDAQAGDPAARWRSAGPPPTSAPTTSPTRRTAPSGSSSQQAGGPGRRRRRLGGPAARRSRTDPAVVVGDLARWAWSRCSKARSPTRPTSPARLPAAGAHRAAPDRRGEVAAPAHQPGRARRRSTTGCSASSPPWSSTAASCATWHWATE